MTGKTRINESNLKKINRFNLKNKVYKSAHTNNSNTYKSTMGLKTSSDVEKVLGKEGIDAIGSEITTDKNISGKGSIRVSDARVSTGGGDPLPPGSKDNEFLVAENAEEAEELRERTDGEVPVRTLQYRDDEGKFSDGVDKVQRKLKDNAGENSREYFKNKAGLTDKEFEKRVKSLGMTKDDFVYESLNNINAVSKGVIDKKALMNHLKYEKKLTDSQRARIYGDRKYGLKDSNDLKNEDARIKYFEIMNQNKAKENDPSKRMKKYWRKRKQSEAMKNKIAEIEKKKQEEANLKNQNNFIKREGDLSGYTEQEIAAARKEIAEFNGISEEFIDDKIVANYLNSKKGDE